MKRFYIGGRGHGKVAAMEEMKKAQRGPDARWAYYDEIGAHSEAFEMVQRMIHAQIVAQRDRHEAFLKDLFRINLSEEQGIKEMDPVIVERVTKRMNEEGLPVNFWETVTAHKMLEDEVGRKLVADIIAKKVGCNVERTSD